MKKHDWARRCRISAVLLILAALIVLPSMAAAVEPVVKTVPWVATNPLLPHDTWSGKAITLKGTTDVSGAGFEYTWDFGDGSPVVTAAVGTNNNALQAIHTYTGSDGDIFVATLTVEDTTTGDTASKNYFVAIRNQTLEVEVNVAIDEGLWYLHKNQRRWTSAGIDYGDWLSIGNYSGVIASCINAFEANGHVESLAGDDNPYKETVARGLKSLFTWLDSATTYVRNGLHPEDYDNDGSPDGNGIRIYNRDTYYYQQGMLIDAIIASGTPGAVTVTGGANVINKTYQEIVQDMVDAVANGQYNHPTASNRGGWYYSWGNAGDNSISQWAAIGLIPAIRNGWAQMPSYVTDLNPTWLKYSQHANGYFGYTSSSPIWGTFAVTPSGMVQMVMDGIGRGDGGTPAAGFPSWDKAEKYIHNNFNSTSTSAYYNIKRYYYGLFSFVKSMRLHQPPITLLRDYTQTPTNDLDWYHAETSKGDWTNGVARTLVNDQDKSMGATNGRWSGHYYSSSQNPFETPWAIMMLGQTLFEAGSPVAVAQAIPNPGVVGQVITLDGSASFHQDSGKSIDSWEWDLDNDGVYDASGPSVTHSWPAVGDYPVKLRVSDNGIGSEEKFDDTIVIVRIDTPPIAPTADAGGPYVLCPNAQPWFLDGTGSVNPDEGGSEPEQPGDTIAEYAWDLDNDGAFDDAFGPQPDVTAYLTAMGPGSYLVQLQVTDTTAASYPSSGMDDLSDKDVAQVFVKVLDDQECSTCIDDLTARPKLTKMQLNWTDTGAHHYNVYRSTTQGGPYTFIASTTSTYSVYTDYGLTTGETYYYVVREAALNSDELCQSNEASATLSARIRR
jgi:hypothetical protein